MLDVQRRVDVDAGVEQFLDIEVALGMAAAGRVGVGSSSTSTSCGLARQHGIEVHLLEPACPCTRPARRGMTSSPSRSAWVSGRPCVSTTPTTTSTPSSRLAWAASQHLVVLPTPGAAPRKIFSRPAALLPARRRRATPPARAWRGLRSVIVSDLTSGRRAVQGQVQREHVDARLAQEPELPASSAGSRAAQRILREAACLGDAGHLEQCGLWRDVGIEPAAGGGHEVDGTAAADCLA